MQKFTARVSGELKVSKFLSTSKNTVNQYNVFVLDVNAPDPLWTWLQTVPKKICHLLPWIARIGLRYTTQHSSIVWEFRFRWDVCFSAFFVVTRLIIMPVFAVPRLLQRIHHVSIASMPAVESLWSMSIKSPYWNSNAMSSPQTAVVRGASLYFVGGH